VAASIFRGQKSSTQKNTLGETDAEKLREFDLLLMTNAL